jgi:hypothetical protein
VNLWMFLKLYIFCIYLRNPIFAFFMHMLVRSMLAFDKRLKSAYFVMKYSILDVFYLFTSFIIPVMNKVHTCLNCMPYHIFASESSTLN